MLTMLRKKRNAPLRAYKEPRVFVPENIATTPSEMYALTKQGIPIGTHMLDASMFNDGVATTGYQFTEVPFMLRRGVELSDVCDYQNRCRAKAKSAIDSARQA